jgi:ribonuclease HI
VSEQPIVVFTDGAAKGNPGPGGWGVVIVAPSGEVAELGGAESPTTNNKMELTGAIQALTYLRDIPGPVAIHTDSTYVITGIREWIFGWLRRGWKTATGSDVLNRDLWERLWGLVTARGKGTIQWHYVRGHIGIPGNERVDEIASAFAVGRDPGLYRGPVTGYTHSVLDLPADTTLPRRSSASSPAASKASKAKAYSYLSVVDGTPMRHGTWTECEQRVKGRSGARFKKATSEADELAIWREWRIDPSRVKLHE